MALPLGAIVVEAPTFDHLSCTIRDNLEAELHRKFKSPKVLKVYINSLLANDARRPQNGTALIAWAKSQGILEVDIRLDEKNRFLNPPQCAYWMGWD